MFHEVAASGSRSRREGVAAPRTLIAALALALIGALSVPVPASAAEAPPAPVEAAGDVAPTITGEPARVIYIGEPYAFQYTMTGSPTPTAIAVEPDGYFQTCRFTDDGGRECTMRQGTLPPGLTLSPEGLLSGTPTGDRARRWTVGVAAVNAVGVSSRSRATFFIQHRPPQLASSLPEAFVGTPYSATVALTRVPGYLIEAEGLPAGLWMNTVGEIDGVPTEAGRFSVEVEAHMPGTPGESVTRTYELTVSDVRGQAPTISGSPDGVLYVGVPYSFRYTMTGTPAPTATLPSTSSGGGGCERNAEGVQTCWGVQDGPPPGMTLSPEGVLSGTPTEAGLSSPEHGSRTWRLEVAAVNAVGESNYVRTDIVVRALPPELTTAALPAAAAGTPYTAALTGTGSPAPTFRASGLPAGLTMSPAGEITGTPTASGQFSVTVTAANAGGEASRAYDLTVAAAPSTADLSVSVAGLPERVTPGSTFDLQVTVSNRGPAAAPSTRVAVALSPNLTVVGAPGAQKQGAVLGVSGIGYTPTEIRSGGAARFVITVRVSGKAGSAVGATAAAVSAAPDPKLIDNVAAVTGRMR